MSIMNALASVAVNDLNSAVQWYEKVLGKPPDSRPMPEVAEWRFERGGWLQVYKLPSRAGSGSVTLAVSNIDDQVAELNKLGIDTGQRSSGDKVKTLMITDPDGNHIAFAEAIDPSMAQ
jgi:predicted enzyme related to lactoylglutathione lyase